MASIHTLETLAQRVLALESRLGDIEAGYGQTISRLERRTVAVEITLGRIAAHLGVTPAADADVDAVLDEG